MSEWMDGWMNEWMNGWMDEWMNESVSEWSGVQWSGVEWVTVCMNECMDGWVNERTSEWMNKWMNEWTNEWISEYKQILYVADSLLTERILWVLETTRLQGRTHRDSTSAEGRTHPPRKPHGCRGWGGAHGKTCYCHWPLAHWTWLPGCPMWLRVLKCQRWTTFHPEACVKNCGVVQKWDIGWHTPKYEFELRAKWCSKHWILIVFGQTFFVTFVGVSMPSPLAAAALVPFILAHGTHDHGARYAATWRDISRGKPQKKQQLFEVGKLWGWLHQNEETVELQT